MLKTPTRLCLYCELHTLVRTPGARAYPSWHSTRSMTQLQRRKPSRMALSPRVAQSRSPGGVPTGRPAKRRTNSPFGGMNVREANIRGVPERRSQAEPRGVPERRPRGELRGFPERRSQAELKRATHGRERPEREKGSSDAYKALKMQRSLSPVSYIHRAAVKGRISEIDSFDDFPLLPVIRDSISPQALQGVENMSPTPVQRLAIPTLLGSEGKHVRRRQKSEEGQAMEQFLIAAETGSGKTLAYLLATIDAIKRAEFAEAEAETNEQAEKEGQTKRNPFEVEAPSTDKPHPTTGRPRAIILLPTSELVSQVGALAKSLSHTIKFRAGLISAAYSAKVIRNRLFSPSGIDILISTPHLLASIAESDPNILSRVTHLICDEADSLFDRSFSPLTSAIIDKTTPSLRQLILCSATIPRSLDSYLRKRFPDIRRLVTPNLHAIPRRVQLGVVDVEKEPYHGNKSLACADTIWSIGKSANEYDMGDKEKADVKRMIVFVNEREKASEVADYLQSKGIDAAALSRDTNEQRQSELLAIFTSSPLSSTQRQPSDDPSLPFDQSPSSTLSHQPLKTTRSPPKRTLPNTKVLVTTDLGSRGIDTLAVRHVILYDVPHTTIDFIHRLGRTGRMGRRGRGIVLVGKGDRRDIVREVREGMFRGQALV